MRYACSYTGRDDRIAQLIQQRIVDVLDAKGLRCPQLQPTAHGGVEDGPTTDAAPDIASLSPANEHAAAPTILLCDHGTPTPSVNAVREVVLGQLKALVGSQGAGAAHVVSCSMERRDGAEYDFNDPLLESALMDASDAGPIVVALMFLQPGKHAGAGGDIAEIIATVRARRPALEIHTTAVLGSDPLLIDVLLDRLKQAVAITLA